jgi:hypothetical protein
MNPIALPNCGNQLRGNRWRESIQMTGPDLRPARRRRRYDPAMAGRRAKRAGGRAASHPGNGERASSILENFNVFDRYDVREQDRPARRQEFREKMRDEVRRRLG